MVKPSAVLEIALLVTFKPNDFLTETQEHRVAELLDAVDQSESGPGLAWNIPADVVSAPAVGSRKSVRDLLIRRFQAGDVVIPMGLAGAPHSMLTIPEIESSLAWCLSNPWSSGLEDTLRTRPEMIMVRDFDLGRAESRQAYADFCGRGVSNRRMKVISLVGGVLGPTGARTAVWMSSGSKITTMPVVVLAGVPARQSLVAHINRLTRRRVAVWKKETGVRVERAIIEVNVTADYSVGEIADLIGQLEQEIDRRQSWSQVSVTAKWVHGGESGDRYPPPPGMPLPLSPTAQESIALLRHRRPTRLATRQILELASGRQSSDASRMSQGRRRAAVHPEVIASMMGFATLVGPGQHAFFDGGRFCGLSGDPHHPGADRAARNLLMIREATSRTQTTLTEEVVASVSYESEISRGIRSESLWTNEEQKPVARMISTFAFVEEHDSLVISLSVNRCPDAECDGASVLPLSLSLAGCGSLDIGSISEGTVEQRHGTEPGSGRSAGMTSIWGSAFEARVYESPLVWLAVSGSGTPLPWQTIVTGGRDPRLHLGGMMAIPADSSARSLGMVMAIGDLEHPIIKSGLAHKLPSTILRELDNRINQVKPEV